jgi:hypothetical protein
MGGVYLPHIVNLVHFVVEALLITALNKVY